MWRKAKLAVSATNVFKKSRAFKLEGDHTLNTPQMRAVRRGLKQSPLINAELRRSWDVLDMIKDEETGNLTKDAYVELNVKIQKAMVSDFDEEEARHDAVVDWNTDIAKFAVPVSVDKMMTGILKQ